MGAVCVLKALLEKLEPMIIVPPPSPLSPGTVQAVDGPHRTECGTYHCHTPSPIAVNGPQPN